MIMRARVPSCLYTMLILLCSSLSHCKYQPVAVADLNADFNGDGFPDIAFGINAAQPQIAIIFGDGHGGFSAPRVITVANDTTFAIGLVLLDANKDSKPDLVVNTAKVTISIRGSFLL